MSVCCACKRRGKPSRTAAVARKSFMAMRSSGERNSPLSQRQTRLLMPQGDWQEVVSISLEKSGQMEVTTGMLHIAQNLLLERIRGWKAHLRTDATEKDKFQWRGVGQLYRLEVEKVRFHGKGHSVKCGTVADVGDCIQDGAIANANACDVDPVGGKQFVIGGKIDGQNGKLGSDAASARRSGVDRKGPAQKGTGRGHVSGSN